MKLFIQFILFISFFNLIYANSIEDRALNAYKNKNYKLALKLYTKEAKKSNLKALLMLGLFFEKGIVVQKDTKRAIKIYKYILKKTKNIKDIIKQNDKKSLAIATEALNRLYALTNNKKYLNIAQKLKNILKPQNRDEQEIIQQLFTNKDSNPTDNYLLLCPNAKSVPIEDREGIEEFDCELFENFPKRMVLFMKLRRVKFNLSDSNNKQLLAKVNRQIAKLIKPMIKFLQQEAIECYQDAQTNADIKACDYDYLLKSDPLLFDNAAYKMGQAVSSKSDEIKNLDIYTKEKLIKKLIEDISNNSYGKPWRNYGKI